MAISDMQELISLSHNEIRVYLQVSRGKERLYQLFIVPDVGSLSTVTPQERVFDGAKDALDGIADHAQYATLSMLRILMGTDGFPTDEEMDAWIEERRRDLTLWERLRRAFG